MTDEPRFMPSSDEEPDDDELSVSALEPDEAAGARRGGALPDLRSLRRAWRVSGVVAIVALVAIVVVAVAPHISRLAPPRVSPPYTALAVSSDVARCLVGSSWSRDGRQIAAVQSYTCGAPYLGPAPAQRNLFIFDAGTGQQVASFALDDAVNAGLRQDGIVTGSGSIFAIAYYATEWSPDDQLLAVPFAVYGEQASAVGVAVVSLAAHARGQVTALVTTPDVSNSQQTNGFSMTPVDRWDVTQGTHSVIYLARALAYRWLPDDVLVADAPLASSATSGGASASPEPSAAGDPIGGQTFSLWHAGVISPVNATSCGDNGVVVQPVSAPYAHLSLATPVWSPDGRYLLEASIQARLPAGASGPKPLRSGANPCDAGPAPDQLPSAPLHDRALRSALDLLDARGGNQLTLAWSLDGQRLAVASLAIAQGSGSVVVYDCASGTAISHFTGDQFEVAPAVNDTAQNPTWSPNGTRLLLTINGPVSKLVILGPAALDG